MDLDDSALKSARHNEAMTTPQSEVGSNGSSTPLANNSNNNKLDDVKGKGIEINGPVDNSPPLVKFNPTSKGFGLKKWKRIKRGAHKVHEDSSSSSINNDKLLKRGLANPVAISAKPVHFSAGSIQRSDRSVSSTNAVFRSPGVLVDGFGVIGDMTFNALSESENSEDRSSKSSTAASAPKGSDYVTSNGTKSERSMMYDGEFSDEAQDRERPIGEELHAGCERGNDRESENVSQEDLVAESPWEVKEEKNENQGSFTDHDPLMESIFNLQTAQKALERELQKFKEIGKGVIFGHSLEDVGIPSDFTSDLPGPSRSEQSQHRDGARHSFNSLGSEVVSLKQNIILLQCRLQKAADRVKSKEARVAELEAILGSSSKKEEKTIDTVHQSSRDMESELEGLFRQKIEGEVQYLAISRTARKLRAAAVDQATLLEEQKIVASEQAQLVHRLGDAESKAAMLKTQAEKLESYCEDIATTNEKLKQQKKVYKYSSCFLIQLVLLAVVVRLFLMQMSPNYAEVVPT